LMLQENNIGAAAQAYHVQDNEAYIKARRRAAAEEENGSLSYDPMAALANKGPEAATAKAVINARKQAEMIDNFSTHGSQANRIQLMEGSKVDRLLVSYVGRESLLEETAYEKYCSLYFPKPVLIRRRDGLLMQNLFSCQRRLMGLQDSRGRGSSANFLEDLGVPTKSPLGQLGQLPYSGAKEDDARVVRPEEATIDDLLRPFLLPKLPSLPQQPNKLFGNWKLITDEASRIDDEHKRRDVRQQKKNLLEKKRMGTLSKSEAAELNSMLMSRKRTIRESNNDLLGSAADSSQMASLQIKKDPKKIKKRRGFGSSSSSGSAHENSTGAAASPPTGALQTAKGATKKVTEWLEKGGPASGQSPASPPADSLAKSVAGKRGGANSNAANLEELEKFMVPSMAAEMKSIREAAEAANMPSEKPKLDRSRKARRERKLARLATGDILDSSSSTSGSDEFFYHSSSIDSVLEARGGKPLSPSDDELDSDFDSITDSIPMLGNNSRVIGGVHQRKRYFGDDVPSLKQLDAEERREMMKYARQNSIQRQQQQKHDLSPMSAHSPDSLDLDLSPHSGNKSNQRHHHVDDDAPQKENNTIHSTPQYDAAEDSLQLDDEDFRKIFSSISQHFDPTSLHPSLRTKHLQKRKEEHSKQLREDIANQIANRQRGGGGRAAVRSDDINSQSRSMVPSISSSPKRSRRQSGAVPLPSGFDAADMALL
jgi:hypothetical protein